MRFSARTAASSNKWRRTMGRFAASLVVLTCLGACDSKSGTAPGATGPTPTPTPQAPPAAPPFARFEAVGIAARTLTVTWGTVLGATSYVIEAGSSSGANDLGSVTAAGNLTVVATLADMDPREEIYVRVKGVNAAGTSPPSPEVVIGLPDMRDVIEALFLNTGPYSSPPQQRSPAARMAGWSSNSQVSVRVPEAVTGEQMEALVRTVGDLNARGLNFSIERSTMTFGQYNQQRPPGITVIIGEGLCNAGNGVLIDCAISTPNPVYATSSVRMESLARGRKVWVHEFAHAAVGLNHIWIKVRATDLQQVRAYDADVPVMGNLTVTANSDGHVYSSGGFNNGALTNMELEAIRRVYAAGLRAGSSLADFAAQGLIKP